MTAYAAASTGGGRAAVPGAVLPGGERTIDRAGYLFVALFAAPFLVFNIGPVFFGTYVAFTEWSIIGTPRWVGFENFREAFSDEWVGVAFTNILLYGAIIVPGVTVLGP